MDKPPLFRLQNFKTKFQETRTNVLESTKAKAPGMMHEQQGHRDISTLQARLHMEADKIRKWKVQTELDIKEKEKKLIEASVRMDTMKKSLIDLQLENEKISYKLKDEVANREEVMKRIHATREMCNLLKSHASKMEERVTRCETEKTELKYLCRENSRNFEDLTEQFKNLRIQSVEKEKNILKNVEIERQSRLEKEEALKSRMDASMSEIEKLCCLLEEKNKEIYTLKEKLTDKELKVGSLEQYVGQHQVQMKAIAEELSCKEEEVKDSVLRIARLQDSQTQLEKKHKTLEQEFQNLQISKDSLILDSQQKTSNLEQQLKNALADASSTSSRLERELEKLRICEEKLKESNEAVENLKSSRDLLVLEKTDAEMHLDMQKYQVSNLLAEQSEDREELQKLGGEIKLLTKRLEKESSSKIEAQDEADQLSGKLSAMEVERNSHKEQICELKEELTEKQGKIQSLESLLSEEESRVISLQARIEQLQHEQREQREQLSILESDAVQAKSLIEERDTALHLGLQEKEDLDTALKDLKTSEKCLQKRLMDSTTEAGTWRTRCEEAEEQINKLSSQLEDLSEQKAETGKSLTNQQKKAAATAKQNRELEKELKVLKAKCEKSGKDLHQKNDELSKIQDNLESLQREKTECEKSLRDCENQMLKREEECERDQEAAKSAIKKAEEMQEAARKEKENALALTDCQLQEMMATLDTYKQNNEATLLEKEAQIQSLTDKLETLESSNTRYKEENKAFQKDLDDIKEQLKSTEKEKDEASSILAAQMEECAELKKKIKSLETTVQQGKFVLADSSDEGIYNREPSSMPSVSRSSSSADLSGRNSARVVAVTPQKQQIPATPILQQEPVTPIPMTPKTPRLSAITKTPQRSILKACDSVSKRRKVAFAASGKSPVSSSEESDLMELDTEQTDLSKTPILFKSPVVKLSPKTPRKTPTMTLNRAPRGPPVDFASPPVCKTPNTRIRKTDVNTSGAEITPEARCAHKKQSIDDLLLKEKDAFESLYQDFDKNQLLEAPKTPNIRKTPKILTTSRPAEAPLQRESAKTPNVRKAAVKKAPKFFSTSPRSRHPWSRTGIKNKAADKRDKDMDFAWLDSDSVFAFDPED